MVIPSELLQDAPPALEVEELVVRLGQGASQREVLRGLSLTLRQGRWTCLVGESGSGKSVLIRSLLGIQPDGPGIVSGRIRLHGPGEAPLELLEGLEQAVEDRGPAGWWVRPEWQGQLERRLRPLWGTYLGYVAQHAALSLDPTAPIGRTLEEAIRRRQSRPLSAATLRDEAVHWLELLRFEEPAAVLKLYPAQLSGGMAQRAVLASVLARGARLVFADEPTTGLDREAQEALIELLGTLRRQQHLETLVLVTHDYGVAERLADDVAMLEEGRVVEKLEAAPMFGGPGPTSPGARQLLEEFRRLTERSRRGSPEAVSLAEGPGMTAPFEGGGGDGGTRSVPSPGIAPRLEATGIRMSYARSGAWWSRARRTVLEDVSLTLEPGEIVGLVGPSGTGKSTLAAALARLASIDAGRVLIDGVDLHRFGGTRLRQMRRDLQVLYQQPAAAIHPRMRVGEALLETARRVMGMSRPDAAVSVERVLDQVRLREHRHAFPAQLSGGQLRRVGLARVLLVRPRVLFADEPTAGVDAALRAEMLALIAGLCEEPQRTSILLISHDMQVIRHLADRIVTLRNGRLFPVSS